MREPLVIAVAQPPCTPYDIAVNAATHAATVRSVGARVVVFPELSLTGYELDAPAIDAGDLRLVPIVEACASAGSVALVGAPVRGGSIAHRAAGRRRRRGKRRLPQDVVGHGRVHAVPLLQRLPPERVLLETDGPFARSGSHAAVPSDLPGTLDHLARLWEMPTSEARKAVAQNQQRLHGAYGEPPPAC